MRAAPREDGRKQRKTIMDMTLDEIVVAVSSIQPMLKRITDLEQENCKLRLRLEEFNG